MPEQSGLSSEDIIEGPTTKYEYIGVSKDMQGLSYEKPEEYIVVSMEFNNKQTGKVPLLLKSIQDMLKARKEGKTLVEFVKIYDSEKDLWNECLNNQE